MGAITDDSAKEVIAQLLYLEGREPGRPISLLINSGGGKVAAGLAIVDVMQDVSAPVRTVCVGRCSSMAAVVLAAGEPGARHAAAHCKIMIHEPSMTVPGNKRCVDLGKTQRRLEQSRLTTQRLLAEYSGRPETELQQLLHEETYFTAEEARALGLVDHVGGIVAAPAPGDTAPSTAKASPATKPGGDREESAS